MQCSKVIVALGIVLPLFTACSKKSADSRRDDAAVLSSKAAGSKSVGGQSNTDNVASTHNARRNRRKNATSSLSRKVYNPEWAKQNHERWPVAPAFLPDEEYAGRERIPARRLVYRVSELTPGKSRKAAGGEQATGELTVTVSDERLRARFSGQGWPVASGSEVRLRADSPGAYVFDERGGRPLPPGELQRWFSAEKRASVGKGRPLQGRPLQGRPLRDRPLRPESVYIRSPERSTQNGPGALLCALLAELAGRKRAALAHECGRGGSPPKFRIGHHQAIRTADVPLTVPKRALRSDEQKPPKRPGLAES